MSKQNNNKQVSVTTPRNKIYKASQARARRVKPRNPYKENKKNPENVAKRRMKVTMQSEYYDYLLSLLHPWRVANVILPDWSTFPRGTAQIRTVGTIKTGTTPNNTGFFITITPSLYKSLYFNGPALSNATITVDGTTYTTGSQISVHNYATSWANVLGTYRVVSMGVRLKYIGSALNAQGQVCSACTPPAVNLITNFNALSSYNYAYTGAAVDGIAVVWLPVGLDNFQPLEPDYSWSLDDTSVLQLSALGLADSTSVYNFEWVVNIETYSTDQLLTANVEAGKPDSAKMSESLAVAAQAFVEKKTSGTHESAGSRVADVLHTVAQVGEKVATNVLKHGFETMILGGL